MGQDYCRYFVMVPDEVGLNSASLASEATSNDISAEGYNQITYTATYTYGAGTSVTVYVDVSEDGTNWAALTDGTAQGPAGASGTFTKSLPMNHDLFRLRASCGGTPTSSDLISVTVRKGVM